MVYLALRPTIQLILIIIKRILQQSKLKQLDFPLCMTSSLHIYSPQTKACWVWGLETEVMLLLLVVMMFQS